MELLCWLLQDWRYSGTPLDSRITAILFLLTSPSTGLHVDDGVDENDG